MTRLARPLAVLLALGSLCFAATTRAEEKRELPDYDGRGKSPATPGDVLLWVPRVLLAPPYFVSEYLLRRPLGFLISGAERTGLPILIYDFFTFGPDHKAGVFPTAFIDFGFRPSVGLYAFWNDAFMRGHDLRLTGGYGGHDWRSGSFGERFRLGGDPGNQIGLGASGLRRPDYTFFGLGPSSRQSNLVRYGRDTLEARLFVEQRLSRVAVFHAEVALRSVDFRRGGMGDDRVLDQAIASGDFASPPGYARGYTIVRSAMNLTYDGRQPRPAPGSGFRFQLEGAHSANVRRTETFVSYGASAGGYLDLDDRGRVLSLSVATRFADPIEGAEVPFTELVRLGGSEPMRGFYPDRLADRSAASADLAYRWPIWIWLDGAMHAEVGNVFGEHLEGFDPGLLRWSGSLGVESAGSSDDSLQILVGLASETFESGGKLDSFRFLLGTTHGF